MKFKHINYVNWILLAIVLILGFFIRIFNLGSESLWFDEAHTFYIASSGFKEMLSIITNDVHPPFYFILVNVWIKLFGDSEFLLRLPSVIFAVLSIIFIYKLGNLIFDREVGIISSLLLSFSLFNITYSQEARTYSLLCLLVSVSYYYFYAVLNVVNRKNIFLYLISSLLLIYSHYFGVFILISQNLFFISIYLFSNKRAQLNLKQWFMYQIILLISFLPWLIVFVKQTLKVQSGFWIPEPEIGWIIHTFTIYSGSREILLIFILIFISIFLNTIYKNNFLLKNFATFKLVSSFIKKLDLRSVYWSYYLLILWLIIPIIIPFLISKISQPIYVFRYTIVSLVAFYLLMAIAIKSINNLLAKILVILIILVFSTISIVKYHITIKNPHWRDAISYIDKNASNGDLLIFNPGYKKRVNSYYSNRHDLLVYDKPLCSDHKSCKEQIVNIQKKYKNFWIILSKGPGSKRKLINNHIKNLSRYSIKRFNRIELYYFNKEKF